MLDNTMDNFPLVLCSPNEPGTNSPNDVTMFKFHLRPRPSPECLFMQLDGHHDVVMTDLAAANGNDAILDNDLCSELLTMTEYDPQMMASAAFLPITSQTQEEGPMTPPRLNLLSVVRTPPRLILKPRARRAIAQQQGPSSGHEQEVRSTAPFFPMLSSFKSNHSMAPGFMSFQRR